MLSAILKAEITGATVTDANLDYIGSITIDSLILKASGIYLNEQVHVWNNTNGARLVTYALEGEPGSGVICINGAGAHLFSIGNNVSVAAFSAIKSNGQDRPAPVFIKLDDLNRMIPAEPGSIEIKKECL